jgi:hypothetical protein
MSIYKIKPDIKNYKVFYLIVDDKNIDLHVEGYFDFKGQSKANDWNGARVYLDNTYDNAKTELPIADICKFNVHALAYSEKAVDVLDTELTRMELIESGRFMIGKTVLDESKLSKVCLKLNNVWD